MKSKFFNIIPRQGQVSILLYGNVGDGEKVDSGEVVTELMQLASSYEQIDVHINSNGGDVFSGMAIYNALRTCKANICIYVDGVAASIAAVIALCGKPLYMSPYARLMLHAVSGGAFGNASELRDTADMIESLQGDLASMIADKCGKKKDEIYASYFDEKDHWLTAQQALDMKLSDGIYDMPAVQDAPQTTEEIYKYFNNRLLVGPQTEKNMALIDDIKKIPSFADKADEKAILLQIQNLENKATKADSLEQANKAYKQKIENQQKQEDELYVSQAVQAGKITEEQKSLYLSLMKTGREDTRKLLDGMKPKSNMRAADFIKEGSGSSKLCDMTWDDIDRMGKLSELKSSNPDVFKNKFEEKFGVKYID